MTNAAARPAYFIGISLPTELNSLINTLKSTIHDNDTSTLKPLVPHITLLHPPSLRDMPIETLRQGIQSLSKQIKPFAITLDSIGFFEREVCYLHAQSSDLNALQSMLVQLLPLTSQSTHYDRPYTAHVTIAQKYHDPQIDTGATTTLVESNINVLLGRSVSLLLFPNQEIIRAGRIRRAKLLGFCHHPTQHHANNDGVNRASDKV
ncbi:MAG: 2'-5' RNA ligase family protein [Chloroflexi bacterium]|nr:MAG: 2'-5' RNA ligase family protein [Chloroflexota bacterium]